MRFRKKSTTSSGKQRKEDRNSNTSWLIYESVMKEAECLKRMYRLARDLKVFNAFLVWNSWRTVWCVVSGLLECRKTERKQRNLKGKVDEGCKNICYHWTEAGNNPFLRRRWTTSWKWAWSWSEELEGERKGSHKVFNKYFTDPV